MEQFSIFETEFEKDLSDRETLIERALEDKKLSDAKKKAFLERYKEQISELRDRSEEGLSISLHSYVHSKLVITTHPLYAQKNIMQKCG